jgi:replicative DNA helicase
VERIYNLEFEQQALCCVLFNPAVWREAGLKVVHFYDQRHIQIAAAIERLIKAEAEIDYLTICSELNQHNALDNAGGRSYLTQLHNAAVSSLNASYYADELKGLYGRRQMQTAVEKIGELAQDTQRPLPALAADARQFLDEALNSSRIQAGRSMVEALREFDDALEARKGKGFSLLGVSTGYPDIDYKLDGLQDGWLYLIAARPGMGKTAMLGNLAVKVAKQGKRALFFSAEMHEARIVARMIAAETGIHADILKHAAMESSEEWSRYYQAIETFESLPMRLYRPDECRSVEQIENITRQLHAADEVDIIFVDYLQLLQVESLARTTTREQEVTKIAQGLKRITGLNIPVVSAAQLNRATELRTEGRPQLSDLRESGSLEQEADAVCFLYHPDDEPETSLSFIVAKNRDGALGSCPLYYDKTTQRISSAMKTTLNLREKV